jgi:HlyD family secretion protein
MKNTILFFSVTTLLLACSKPKESIKATYKPLTISVYASGIIKALDQYEAYSSDNGILEKIFVTEGDLVSKGDILFQIDNRTSKLNSENAKLALELSKENSSQRSNRLLEIETQVSQAKDKYILDSTLYVRQKALWSQNVGTKNEYDQRELTYNSSRNAYLSAQARYEYAKLQLQSEYKQAQNNYKITKEREGNFFVRSQINGYVYSILKDQGEFISTQMPLALLGHNNSFYVELQIDEYDIVKIKKDQEVFITMDSYKKQVFTAKIKKVYPIMNEKTRTFKVDAIFTEAPTTLYPNLTVEANIIINKKEKALVLPRKYIVNDSIVKTIDDETIIVTPGLFNYEYMEVLSGIDTTTQIILP